MTPDKKPAMRDYSYVSNAHPTFIESLYRRYLSTAWAARSSA